jgi:S-adenosylmethionine hydrolase
MDRPVITLTTDFGLADAYVGTMKGVILGICPEATLVDLSHQVPPQDVRAGAFAVAVAAPYFPDGTVHLVVVDPGVGSERRAVAVQTDRWIFVAPDNGVLSLALAGESLVRAVELADPRYRLPAASATFHGRDIFAPAAAHLARGASLADFGPPVTHLVSLSWPPPEPQRDGSLLVWVLHIDRFGNIVLNLRSEDVAGWPRDQTAFEIAGRQVVGLHQTFADVLPGKPVAYVGSSGYVELGVRNGSAAAEWGIEAGAYVRVDRMTV